MSIRQAGSSDQRVDRKYDVSAANHTNFAWNVAERPTQVSTSYSVAPGYLLGTEKKPVPPCKLSATSLCGTLPSQNG